MKPGKSRNLNDLINNPDYLAYRFDFNTETVGFLPIEEAEIQRVSALNKRYIDPDRELVEVPIAKLLDLVNSPPEGLNENPPRFIFHTAFCASTFLSRCLAVDGKTVGLREPQILLDAANAKRLQWKSNTTSLDHHHLPKLALALLQKHAPGPGKLVIKPINSVNNIVPELLQAAGPTRSLMLFTDARNFILSTLKKGEGGKQTIRSMFDLIRCDFPNLQNLQLTHTIHMTDLRIIMTLWRLQIEQAQAAIQQSSSDCPVASLYGEKLIDHPLESLQAANTFLDLGISAAEVESIATSDERFADAKNEGQRFSKEKRADTYRRLEEFFGGDVDDGLEWLSRNNPGTQLLPELGAALSV